MLRPCWLELAHSASPIAVGFPPRRYNNEYSNRALPKEMKATNQKSSGRCWLFACLNVLRVHMRAKHNLPDDFEFSQVRGRVTRPHVSVTSLFLPP